MPRIGGTKEQCLALATISGRVPKEWYSGFDFCPPCGVLGHQLPRAVPFCTRGIDDEIRSAFKVRLSKTGLTPMLILTIVGRVYYEPPWTW